jgi:glutamate-1-semialdehyde aminotransferase
LDELKDQPAGLVNRFRLALLAHGVDVSNRLGGFLSSAHSQSDVTQTMVAFRDALRILKSEAVLVD